MRYYLADGTLIVRGKFHSCSTGISGGMRKVTSLVIHPVPSLIHADHNLEIRLASYRHGLSPSATSGLIIQKPVYKFNIFRYDQVTVFIASGKTGFVFNQNSKENSIDKTQLEGYSLQIICIIPGKISESHLIDALITIVEAKMLAISEHKRTGSERDGIIIGIEENNADQAGTQGQWIHCVQESIRYGIHYVMQELAQTDLLDTMMQEPAFHVHSSIGGHRWIKWSKKGCPYYPCHFKGQRCDLCYCPLYPCEDETLGEWTTGSRGSGYIWSCAPCTLNHQPVVVQHLRRNPEATYRELKSLLKNSQSNHIK